MGMCRKRRDERRGRAGTERPSFSKAVIMVHALKIAARLYHERGRPTNGRK
jgi:hypothetical protein